jgi:hypothetical protein
MYFSVTEIPELFTTYDYKRLINTVEDHFNESSKQQGFDVSCRAYYNPEANQGVLIYPDVSVYLQDIQIGYGVDFITVKFK